MLDRTATAWLRRLLTWLEPFEEGFSHTSQRGALRRYVFGLLNDSRRTSMEAMWARLSDPGTYQAFQHVITHAPWEAEAVWTRVRQVVPERTGVLILDGTSVPKQGTASVGVARQYCGALGKTANCQVAVSVHLGTDTACLPLTWGLYLPQAWIDDPVRRTAARVPEAIMYATKHQLALDALDRVRGWGVGARVVLADAGYGTSHEFRAALSARGLPYCVQVAPSVKGWTSAPGPTTPPPYQGRGRPRRRPADAAIPASADLAALAATLPPAAWRMITWRPGTKGPLRSRFAQTAFWPAHGVRNGGPLPAAPVQLLIEWPRDEAAPITYWLADVPGETLGLRRAVRLAKGRWRIEQDYRELKDELGLDHFEGRSWPGWHHHVTLASMAYAFLVLETLRGKKKLQA